MTATRTIGVAIAIPDPYGSELQRVREGFGDPLARSIPTHITLMPPTEVSGSDLDTIDKHLRTVAEEGHAFVIRLRGTGTFRPTSPVVFVSVAAGIAECEVLQQAVRSGPLSGELHFPYHPHVTIAHDLPDRVLTQAFEKLAAYDAEFEVWGFSLYEHGADGVWRPQRDYPLGLGSPGPVRKGRCPLG